MDDKGALQKSEQQKDINNVNNANNVKAAAKIAEHSGNPYAVAAGKAVNAADKLTGDKASQRIGKALTNANKMAGLKGKIAQKALNKASESGASNRLAQAMDAKNGGMPISPSASLGSQNSGSKTAQTKETLESGDASVKVFDTTKIVKVGILMMIPLSIVIVMVALITTAEQVFIKSVGLGNADLISDKDAEEKINKKIEKNGDSLNEEVNEDDLDGSAYVPNPSNLVFVANTKYLKRKYTASSLEELEDFYPSIKTQSEKYDKNLVYDFYFKMYNLFVSYRDNYKVMLDLPLMMATLNLQSDDINQVFNNNLSEEDRDTSPRKRPTKPDSSSEFDYSYDWSNYLSTKKESTHDMEIIAQHMVTKIEYNESTKNCSNPVDGFCYEFDNDSYKEFLKEYIEKKYFMDGYKSESPENQTQKDVQEDKKNIACTECSNFVNRFITWLVGIANDDSHGYSQNNRAGGIDYDCSSLVYFGLLNSGFNKDQLGSYPFSTKANQQSILKKVGFQEIAFSTLKAPQDLKPGDILWTSGHTEVYIGKNMNVGAHESENHGITGKYGDQTGKEISVTKYYNDNWKFVYRYNR